MIPVGKFEYATSTPNSFHQNGSISAKHHAATPDHSYIRANAAYPGSSRGVPLVRITCALATSVSPVHTRQDVNIVRPPPWSTVTSANAPLPTATPETKSRLMLTVRTGPDSPR